MDGKKRVGVVADDITGANDIGVMLAGNGYMTGIFSLETEPRVSEMAGLDAVVINTDSRLDDGETAAAKTEKACRLLMELPCDVYHSKTCSVFRGNVGAQFDAMRQCLQAKCTMVVLGFPRTGRTTIHGIHYVNGVELSQTMFRNDPIHPMRQSDLKAILSGQSRGRVAVFDCGLLDLVQEAARRELEMLKERNEYIIFDVRHQEDLKTIARLIAQEKSLGGSSAICQELPKVWGGSGGDMRRLIHPLDDPMGTLVISGSLTLPAKAQVRHLLSIGVASAQLPAWELTEGRKPEDLAREMAERLLPAIESGRPALLYTAQEEDQVRRTKEAGRLKGLSDVQVGRLISDALGEAVAILKARTGLKKVAAAGGETSAAVARGLQMRKMVILSEIEAGLPAMYGYTQKGEELLLVFKSGSFGSPEFLEKSIGSLCRLSEGKPL